MIPLMNVTRQYASIQGELDSAALRVLHSGQYILGKEVSSFEQNFAEYIGVKYAVGVANGTDALTIALMALGIGAGDEVITSAMSFFATAEAIAAVGAVPVFVDCTMDTYTVDVDQIESKISEKTKAIIPVHLYGQCADMDRINAIAEQYHLWIIEDAAQAVGAKYKGKYAGGLGNIGCFSFFPTKNLGCSGDGGIITTDNEELYKLCMAYRAHGSGANGQFAYLKNAQNRVLDVSCDFSKGEKYYNFVVGRNSRLDAIQAALLNAKLNHLESWNEKRREIALQYTKRITNDQVQHPHVADENLHVFYVYVLLTQSRDSFREFLQEREIATGIYFPVPLHLQKVFENLGYKKGDMPNAEYLADHSVAIPMYAELTETEIEQIISAINEYGEKNERSKD